jgi:hypothetical protein
MIIQIQVSTQQLKSFQLKSNTLAQARALLLCFHFTLNREDNSGDANPKDIDCSFFWRPTSHSGSISHSPQTNRCDKLILYQGIRSRKAAGATNGNMYMCKVVVTEKDNTPEGGVFCPHHLVSCKKLHFISISSMGTHHIASMCLSPTGQIAITWLTKNKDLLHGCFDTSRVVNQTCECSVMPLRYSHDYRFHTLQQEINQLVHPFVLDRSIFEDLAWKPCKHQDASNTQQLFQL